MLHSTQIALHPRFYVNIAYVIAVQVYLPVYIFFPFPQFQYLVSYGTKEKMSMAGRIHALASVSEGLNVTEAARIFQILRQTLKDQVSQRYDQQGEF